MQPASALACFFRSAVKEDSSPQEEWLTLQLKASREQLCKKSDFCDQLAVELRGLESERVKRSSAEYQVREILSATNSELRAAGRAREQQESDFTELRSLADSLQIEAETLRTHEVTNEALVERLQLQATGACEAEAAKEEEVISLRSRLAEQEAAAHRGGGALGRRSGMSPLCLSTLATTAENGAALSARLACEEVSRREDLAFWPSEDAIPNEGLPVMKDCIPNLRLVPRLRHRFAQTPPCKGDKVAVGCREEEPEPEMESPVRGADGAAGSKSAVSSPKHNASGPHHQAERFSLAGAESFRQEKMQVEMAMLHKIIHEASTREGDLQQQLCHERELHEEAVRLLSANKSDDVEQKKELQQELTELSKGLEEKEEDILDIKFDMVELQNRLADQARLVGENADAFQQASEELADKDERLSDALVRQEDLLSQINTVSSKLQGKVGRLSRELDWSRAAYQGLEEQTRALVRGLEKERDSLSSELNCVRSEASNVASLRAELDDVKAAAEKNEMEARRSMEKSDVRACQEATRALRATAQLAEVQRHVQSLEKCKAEKNGFAMEELAAHKRRELVLQEVAKAEAQRAMVTQDQLVSATDRLALAKEQLHDLASALQRAQFIERQALERAQEYRTSLELYREFGKDGFIQDEMSFPRPQSEEFSHEDPDKLADGNSLQSRVLVAVDLDLGFATATLSIAPWQTKADFDVVVKDFLKEHKVRPVFADALVRYLQEVEANAVTLPVHVAANLVEIYSRYS